MNVKENSRMISVIVTTYNRKELLKETLDSILAQTYTNFELIVVDNYSNYDFFEHIESFNDDRIRAFQNANDGIIAVNRNYGIKKAKGEYLAFCDDDDLWKQDKLEKQVKVLINNPDKYVGVGSQIVFLGTKEFSKKALDEDFLIDTRTALFKKTVPLSSLMILKCNVLFDESEELKFVEDKDFQISLISKEQKPILLLMEKLIFYRVYQDNNSNVSERKLNNINIYKKHKSIVGKDIDKQIIKSYLQVVLNNLRDQYKPKKARFFCREALKIRKIDLNILTLLLILFSYLPEVIVKELLIGYYGVKKHINI